jgi:hypothetical protein
MKTQNLFARTCESTNQALVSDISLYKGGSTDITHLALELDIGVLDTVSCEPLPGVFIEL